MAQFSASDLPPELAALGELALDLRWTWSHEADVLWQEVDADAWERTRNPWSMLQDIAPERLRALAADPDFLAELQRLAAARRAYLADPGWFALATNASLKGVAYFSMEFGVGEALPLYAGGLGVLAGDYLKTASDLGVPIIGIGLLYRDGYFRQTIDAAGWQHETYPANDPGSMPIAPARTPDGGWLLVPLPLPGRILTVRVWQAQVGRAALYLLDADHPLNSPVDRGITGRLYDAAMETRLLQELVLGIAGWRVIEAVAPDIEVCHLNEGHTAFVVIERARSLMRRSTLSFRDALWATRAGNVFTTHTPVSAGFDRFSAAMIEVYARYLAERSSGIQLSVREVLALGRADAADDSEPFNMAYLAMRGSAHSSGVSRQHKAMSRQIFQPLFPRWPEHEVPVGHITNGVHVPTWDSVEADRLWTDACGKERWRSAPGSLAEQVSGLTDDALWAMRCDGRQRFVDSARVRLRRQLAARGLESDVADSVLDPNILTLGFARRFTSYKRPNLLLADAARLRHLLTDPARPAQLVLAGKAHPGDDESKRLIQGWIALALEPELRERIVFLEDYDLVLAQELVQGVDVWINTPRRPWEACGTSGMKVLVNGGINLSVLDGWWEEAYAPDVGWAVGDGDQLDDAGRDRRDATELLEILENHVVPEFYARDETGLPRRWLARIRASLSKLTPIYSSNRMLQEHVEQLYLPAAAEFRRRSAGKGEEAVSLRAWEDRLRNGWARLHIGESTVARDGETWRFSVPVYFGDILAEDVRVELHAEPRGELPGAIVMERGSAIPGSVNAHIYAGTSSVERAAGDFTIRIVPARSGVLVPAELQLIFWQK
ncbi:MAG TPA: alpha-glucan family phosphorylase [Stellaceae bacterium]|nr:alpha-glucan family phosphorylase [Stellaceae bacterium]